MLTGALQVAILLTVKVPGPVNVWILQFPDSVTVPPVAFIKGCIPVSVSSAFWTFTQPFVESTYTKVIAWPLTSNGKSAATPPIFSEPLGYIVKL